MSSKFGNDAMNIARTDLPKSFSLVSFLLAVANPGFRMGKTV